MSMSRSDWVKADLWSVCDSVSVQIGRNRRKRCTLYTVKITLGKVL